MRLKFLCCNHADTGFPVVDFGLLIVLLLSQLALPISLPPGWMWLLYALAAIPAVRMLVSGIRMRHRKTLVALSVLLLAALLLTVLPIL